MNKRAIDTIIVLSCILLWTLIVGVLACIKQELTISKEIKLACLCNETTCDSGLKFQWPQQDDQIIWVSSTKSGTRFQVNQISVNNNNNNNGKDHDKPDYLIRVSINERRQRVVGYGGALTDSASMLIWNLSEPTRTRLLEDYYGPNGLDYNMGRVPIGGTDMSSRGYTLDDMPPGQTDFLLVKFSLQPEDLELRLPLIQRVNEMRAARGLAKLKLVASCWSPPAWMKENANLIQGDLAEPPEADLRRLEKNPNYAAYARYIVRFIQEYERHQVNLWALTPQNEPRTPRRLGPKRLHHNSVNFTPTQLAAFYKYHVFPQLDAANYSANKLHVLAWDDVLVDMDEYLEVIFADPVIRERVSGVALHWYSQAIRGVPYEKLVEAYKEIPHGKSMITTEACYMGGQKPGDWSHGVGYLRDLILTLRTGLVGWLDWNLALNQNGGPSWANNPLDSAIQIQPEQSSYLKNPMYYALGHVTRFIKPGSTIVESEIKSMRISNQTTNTTSVSLGEAELIAVAAELEPEKIDGQTFKRRLGLVIMNQSEKSRRIRLELIQCKAKENQPDLELTLDPSSFNSFAFVC